jgi:hypothetical protein
LPVLPSEKVPLNFVARITAEANTTRPRLLL